MCCALRLQQDGHRVTVVDPRPPGTATSFGNAGIVATSSIMPYSTPGLWKRIPWMLLSPMSPLMLRWRHLPRAIPWLTRFLAAGSSSRVERIAADLATMSQHVERAHRDLISGHRIDGDLMKPVGYLEVQTGRGVPIDPLEQRLLERHGVRADVLSADEIHQLEPGLARRFTQGVFFPDKGFVTHPFELTRAYTEAFLALGGEIQSETVRRFEIGPKGPTRIVTDLGMHDVDRVVVAAGAWSRPLARQLGSDVPLDTERGYHLSLPWNERITLNRPVFVTDYYYFMCPMRDGVRITSGAELGGLEAGPDFRRIRRVLEDARLSLPGLDGPVEREWMGYRPSMPDSKPIVGRSPRFDRVFFAFGHGHLGLTLSAITGEIIADLVAARNPAVPLEPFGIDRF